MYRSTGVRVLFTGQYWPGANSLYIGRAFQNCGAVLYWVNDTSLFPAWRSTSGRILRSLARPLIRKEWNRRLLEAIDRFQPHLVYITMATHLAPEVAQEIRRRSIPLMCFYHDVIWKEKKHNRFSENVANFDCL